MHIAHHQFNKKIVADNYELQLQSIETSKAIFEKGKYFVLRDMYSETLAAACCAVSLGKPIEEIKDHFKLFQEVALGKYKMGTNVGKEITFTFLGKEYTYVPEEKNYTLTDQGWITAFYSALLFLDLKTIAELNKIDIDKVMEVTNVKGGEHTLLLARFLQHVFKGDQNNFDNLKLVSAAINSDKIPAAVYSYATDIIGGQVDLFGAALLKENDYFNEVYLKTVQWHKDFYKSEPENTEGIFSIPLTAITVLAEHYNIKIEHSSDYTPEIFLKGS